jgi:hypothetical protein
VNQQAKIRCLLAGALSFCLLVAWIHPPGASAAKAPVCGSTDRNGAIVLGLSALPPARWPA